MSEAYKQQVIEFFNSRTNYDREGDRHPREAELLVKSVLVRSGQKILDVATGTGLVAIAAAEIVGRSGSVIGVDFSPGMLAQGRRKVEEKGLSNVEFVRVDVEKCQFESNSFDLIFCCSAIVYFVDPKAILQQWFDWLKPGGAIAFTCPSITTYMAPVQRKVCAQLFDFDLPHINQVLGTTEKCELMLSTSGFTQIAIEILPSGEYINLGDRRMFWRGEGFYPRGNPLLQLSGQELDRLQRKYRDEVEKLAGDRGVWQDTTTFLVVAGKSLGN
jgi:ubiquinone/menaquinone biosynthesis C-methylase UbiE